MWLQVARWSTSDRAIAFVSAVVLNLFRDLLHYRYWNLLEMCF